LEDNTSSGCWLKAVVTNSDRFFVVAQVLNLGLFGSTFGAVDLSACSAVMSSLEETESDLTLSATGRRVVRLPWRSEAAIGWQLDDGRGLRNVGEEPLRCQNRGWEFDFEINGARNVAFDHKEVAAPDVFSSACGRLHGERNLERKPFHSVERRLESLVMLVVDLHLLVQMVVPSVQFEVLINFDVQRVGRFHRGVVGFQFGDDSVPREVDVLIQPNLGGKPPFGEHEGLGVLPVRWLQNLIEFLVHNELNLPLEIVFESDVNLGLCKVDDLRNVTVSVAKVTAMFEESPWERCWESVLEGKVIFALLYQSRLRIDVDMVAEKLFELLMHFDVSFLSRLVPILHLTEFDFFPLRFLEALDFNEDSFGLEWNDTVEMDDSAHNIPAHK